MQEQPLCTVRHINHVGIAVRDIEDTLRFYERIFGIEAAEIETLADQGVRAALLNVGASRLEFIQPTNPDGSVARFIERNGEAMHHICFEVDDLKEKLTELDAAGIELIDKEPRQGLSGRVAFIHPHATRGVLIEMVDRESVRR